MNRKLTEWFDGATPAELDAVWSPGLKETLSPRRLEAIRDRVLAAVPRRKRRRGVYWAAAAVLAAVLCAAGAVLFSGDSPGGGGAMAGVDSTIDPVDSIADPDPVTSEYDVFSDPNVLWGSGEEEFEDGNYIFPGTVTYGMELEKLLELADEENLVAFYVQSIHNIGYRPADPDRLVFTGVLAEDDHLLGLIQAYNDAFDTGTVIAAIHELHDYVFNATIRENTEYLYTFWGSWRLYQAELFRAELIEIGFIPVYELEDVYGQPVGDQISCALTFVGTPGTFLRLEEFIAEGHPGMILFAAGDAQADVPD